MDKIEKAKMALRDARRDLKLAELEARLEGAQGVNDQLRDEASRLRLERDQARAALRAPRPVDSAREFDRQKAYSFEVLVAALAELSLREPTSLRVAISTLPGVPLPVNKIACIKAVRQFTGLGLGPAKVLSEALFDAQTRGVTLTWRFYAPNLEDIRALQDVFQPAFCVEVVGMPDVPVSG